MSRLANAMRRYGEAYFAYQSLVKVDREEAIENLDRAFEHKLETFHTLYDVSKSEVDFFAHADTALLIALRNALHHADHPLFRSLLSELWLTDDPQRLLGAKFLLARHSVASDGHLAMTHYIKLDDIYARLDPSSTSRYRDSSLRREKSMSRFELLEAGMAFGVVGDEARNGRYPANQVYLDMMPVFVSAVTRTFIAMEAFGIAFRGFDAETYRIPFTRELRVDLQSVEMRILTMSAMQLLIGPQYLILSEAVRCGEL